MSDRETIQMIARQAALEWLLPTYAHPVADAVAVAVLREVEKRGSSYADDTARDLLAAFFPSSPSPQRQEGDASYRRAAFISGYAWGHQDADGPSPNPAIVRQNAEQQWEMLQAIKIEPPAPPVESSAPVPETAELRAERDGAMDTIATRDMQMEEARAYLGRLLTHYAPQCEPLPDLLGVVSQIDNLLVGLAPVTPEPPYEPSASVTFWAARESLTPAERVHEAERAVREDLIRRLVEAERDRDALKAANAIMLARAERTEDAEAERDTIAAELQRLKEGKP